MIIDLTPSNDFMRSLIGMIAGIAIATIWYIAIHKSNRCVKCKRPGTSRSMSFCEYCGNKLEVKCKADWSGK